MLKVVIIDDESRAIESLSWELGHFEDSVEIVGKFNEPEEGIKFLQNNKIDCLFLDIEMPTMDGFQFLDKFPDRDFKVVITTAYNEYGIKALKNNAIDYLMKPIDSDDLEATIEKLKEINKHTTNELNIEEIEHILEQFNNRLKRKKIIINTDGKFMFLSPQEIIYIESDGNYSSIHLDDGKKIVITKKIKEVYESLPKDDFFRIHNSYVVNLNYVKEFYKSDGYVVLEGNYKIPVSRQRKSDFLNLI